MTDQIPADKVKKVADWLWEDILANGGLDEEVAPQLAARTEMAEEVRRLLLALLPSPPRPTLADMTEEERGKHVGGQVDVSAEDFGGRAILTGFETVTLMGMEFPRALILTRDCRTFSVPTDEVTPRPDLPRLEWPGDTPAPVPATLTEGSEWGDIHELSQACRESGRDQVVVIDTDGDVSVWDADAGWWAPVTPADGYEPYTILHAGKKAAQ